MDPLTLDAQLDSLAETVNALLALAAPERRRPEQADTPAASLEAVLADAWDNLALTVSGLQDSVEGLRMGVSGDEVFGAVRAGLAELTGWRLVYGDSIALYAPSDLISVEELLRRLVAVVTEVEAFDRPLLSELETPTGLEVDEQTRDLQSVLELLNSAVARDDYEAITLWLPRAQAGSTDPELNERAQAAVARALSALADDSLQH